jgi:hypothetical protein
MIERVEINGRQATASYLSAAYGLVPAAEALLVKVAFDDGEMLFLAPQDISKRADPLAETRVRQVAYDNAIAAGKSPQAARDDAERAVGMLAEIEKAYDPSQPRNPAGSPFPEGIPDAIAFGRVLHVRPYPGDHGIQYERAEGVNKAASRTLYVKRRLLNAGALRAWAAAQGIESALRAEDMHATIAFSREPVDWSAIAPDEDAVAVLDEGGRAAHQFPPQSTPNGALVLKFASEALTRRWQYYLDAGASWDFPEYQPHVTVTYSVAEAAVAGLEPYRGPLIFGPEEWAEVDDGWAGEIEEEPLVKAYNPDQQEPVVKSSIPRKALARRRA